MAVVPAPDVKEAIIEELLSISEITALTSTRIGSAHRVVWGAEPTYMILVRLSGNPGEEQWKEVGFRVTRLDLEFHGPTPELCYDLQRLVDAYLCPERSSGRLSGFKRANCRVNWVELESGPFELTDEVTNLPFITAGYVVYWAGLPV